MFLVQSAKMYCNICNSKSDDYVYSILNRYTGYNLNTIRNTDSSNSSNVFHKFFVIEILKMFQKNNTYVYVYIFFVVRPQYNYTITTFSLNIFFSFEIFSFNFIFITFIVIIDIGGNNHVEGTVIEYARHLYTYNYLLIFD